VLCHDLGRPATTQFINGRWKAPGHEEKGVEITRRLLQRITDEKQLITDVLSLVRYHPQPSRLYRDDANDTALRRLSVVVSLDDLLFVSRADRLGRKTKEAEVRTDPAGDWLQKRASTLGILHAPPEALIYGRDLIKAGLKPSPQFKRILDDAYDAQLEGLFSTTEEAKGWIDSYLTASDLG